LLLLTPHLFICFYLCSHFSNPVLIPLLLFTILKTAAAEINFCHKQIIAFLRAKEHSWFAAVDVSLGYLIVNVLVASVANLTSVCDLLLSLLLPTRWLNLAGVFYISMNFVVKVSRYLLAVQPAAEDLRL